MSDLTTKEYRMRLEDVRKYKFPSTDQDSAKPQHGHEAEITLHCDKSSVFGGEEPIAISLEHLLTRKTCTLPSILMSFLSDSVPIHFSETGFSSSCSSTSLESRSLAV